MAAPETTSWIVGTDTGGTFTDLIALSSDGELRVNKTPSTPPDFERGVVNAIGQANIDPSSIALVHHGTTVTTNALISRTGARTALLTTKGFRDVLEIRRANRAKIYDLAWDPPPPLIPRYNRLEVDERMNYAGEVLRELRPDDVRRVAQVLAKRGIEAVCVSFIHSYANPAHEQLARQILEEELDGVFICASSEVLPEPQEFERTATAVANAYVAPALRRYVGKVSDAVRAIGSDARVLIMHSAGGMLTPETAAKLPIRTATSGPAAGVIAAAAIGKAIDRVKIVSLDMGGTSADIATIQDATPRLTLHQSIEWGVPVGFPSIDLVTIGAGGGSIAWIDPSGVPRSGPQSAGAVPGPACYAAGGQEPTNTDANLVLGRIAEGRFLGGRMKLDARLAREAIEERLAKPLGLDVIQAAAGMLRISNDNMANAIHRVTIQRGVDPREFSLVAFGGAGPLHAVALARELDMPEIIVPPAPGATSALGLLFADTRHDLMQSNLVRLDQANAPELERVLTGLEARAQGDLASEGFARSEMRFERFVDVRYEGQIRVLTIPMAAGGVTPEAMTDVGRRFHSRHEEEFRYAVPDASVEVCALRVVATGLVAKPDFRFKGPGRDARDALIEEREVYFEDGAAGEFRPTRIYDRALLTPGARINGPAIIEQFDSTTVLPPGAKIEVNEYLNLLIRIGG